MLIIIAVLAALVILALLAVLPFRSTVKSLVTARIGIDRSFADLDDLLKRRYDEMPKLIGTCKGYMPPGEKAIQALADARAAWAHTTKTTEKAQAATKLSDALTSLFAAAQNYTELKSNTSFIQLQNRIARLDSEIAAQLAAYNQRVNDYNLRIGRFPANLVASIKRLQPAAAFQVTEAAREDAKGSFT